MRDVGPTERALTGFSLVGLGQDVRANLVPLSQFAGVVGEDDEPFLLSGRHCAGCGCECAGGEEGF